MPWMIDRGWVNCKCTTHVMVPAIAVGDGAVPVSQKLQLGTDARPAAVCSCALLLSE